MRLLEALLGFANYEFDGSDAINLTFRWEHEDGESPQLIVETTLKDLARLTQQDRYEGALTTEQIRTALNSHMNNFVGILKDNRVGTQGSTNWHFTLTLWSKDTAENLRWFEDEWQRKGQDKIPSPRPPEEVEPSGDLRLVDLTVADKISVDEWKIVLDVKLRNIGCQVASIERAEFQIRKIGFLCGDIYPDKRDKRKAIGLNMARFSIPFNYAVYLGLNGYEQDKKDEIVSVKLSQSIAPHDVNLFTVPVDDLFSYSLKNFSRSLEKASIEFSSDLVDIVCFISFEMNFKDRDGNKYSIKPQLVSIAFPNVHLLNRLYEGSYPGGHFDTYDRMKVIDENRYLRLEYLAKYLVNKIDWTENKNIIKLQEFYDVNGIKSNFFEIMIDKCIQSYGYQFRYLLMFLEWVKKMSGND